MPDERIDVPMTEREVRLVMSAVAHRIIDLTERGQTEKWKGELNDLRRAERPLQQAERYFRAAGEAARARAELERSR